MKMYLVEFAPKSKKVCCFTFRIQADTPEGAQRTATNLLRQCGENSLQFKAPKVRPLTTAELLELA